MKNAVVLSLLALVISGVCLVSVFTLRPAQAPQVVDPVVPTAASLPARLSARVDALVEELRGLEERLTSLELRPPPLRAPVTDHQVSREEFEAFRDEVLAALGRPRTGDATRDDPPSPAELQDFRDHVALALTEIRRQETLSKLPSLEQRTSELDATMPKLEDWLGLTRQQSDRMRSALLLQYEREADLLRRWQEGADPEVLGTMKRNDRELHLAELGEVLTPEQLERYASRRGK